MTREEIIEMARKVWSAGDVYVGPSEKTLEEFAALVAAAERSECAKVCEDAPEPDGQDLADRIRARGQK